MQLRNVVSIILIGGLASACSKVPPVDESTVSCEIANRIEVEVEWRQGKGQEERILQYIRSATAAELTAESSIQIALLNNPQIQAFFEDMGIARADVVEAGLLSNPAFSVELRYPHNKGLNTNIEYLITTSLLDIFLIPLRTKLASTEFEQTKLRVSDAILNLAFEVRKTYYELVAERQKAITIRSLAELTSIAAEVSFKQAAVGNVNALEYQLSQSRSLDTKIELSLAQAEIIRISEKFNRLLGFEHDVCLILPEMLAEGTEDQPSDLYALEMLALEERLDLQVARFELIRLCQMLGIKDWWTYTLLSVGIAGERDPDGTNLLGPGFAGEIPLFNYGQAARMRLFAELRQAQERLASLEIQVRSEVREAYKLMMSHHRIIQDYKTQLLPMQEKITTTSEALYNVMGLGLVKLLENKQLEIIAFKHFTENMKKYLMSKVDLDRALGGYLSRLHMQNRCCKGEAQ